MKTYMKLILPIIFALVIFFCPNTVKASYMNIPEFDVSADGVLNKYNGIGGDVVIPDNVTTIGTRAFVSKRDVTSVQMPDSVTLIKSGAFESCYNLKKIKLSKNLTIIEDNAFWGCSSLESIEFPKTLTQIGQGAFCSVPLISTIVIPDSVTEIGNYAFGHSFAVTYDTMNEFTLIGSKGSAAQRYAEKYHFEFLTLADLKTTVSSAKVKSGKLHLTWKANPKVYGYEIQYSTDKKFKKSATKTLTLDATKTTVRVTVKKGKNYYVRVRGYRTQGASRYYSDWSIISKTN